MLNKEEILHSLTEFRNKFKNDTNFKILVKEKLRDSAANIGFLQIFTSSLKEMLSHIYTSENYDAGKLMYEEDGINILKIETEIIKLIEPEDSKLRQYVESIIAYDEHWLIRIATFLGMPTERRDINSKSNLLDLGKNFIGYDDKGSVIKNLLLCIPYIILNLTIVSIKVFISGFKIVTEIFPFLLMTFFYKLSSKAKANISADQPIWKKALLYISYGVTRCFALINHIAYFFFRPLTSPAKGVTAAAREGGVIGDSISGKDKSILGDTVASLFTIASIFITVIGYFTLFPIKLTISFTTTIPYLARHLPAFIVKPIGFIVGKISPALIRFGDIVGKIFDPIVGPVARALHENLNFIEMGLGGCAGLASAVAETSYTLFGSKLLRAMTIGLVSLMVTSIGLFSGLLKQRKIQPPIEPQASRNSSTHELLLELKIKPKPQLSHSQSNLACSNSKIKNNASEPNLGAINFIKSLKKIENSLNIPISSYNYNKRLYKLRR